jgi:hypothetical protein
MLQNKAKTLVTRHQCHLSHYTSITYMGEELVMSG